MANNRGKQKKKDNHELCGSCSLSCENDGDKALGCEGYRRRWFHVQCVDVESLNLTLLTHLEIKLNGSVIFVTSGLMLFLTDKMTLRIWIYE